MVKTILKPIVYILELILFPFFVILSSLSRLTKRSKIGLGPYPLINNIYHKKALIRYGYSAETFVDHVFFITTEFDIRFDKYIPRQISPYIIFVFAIFRYRGLYFYFNGGTLYKTEILWKVEGLLYRIAGIKTVLLPYGSDVQNMNLTRDLFFKHVLSLDYPMAKRQVKRVRERVELWCTYADHVVAGCDWVDYLPGWDSLMLAHFSIDIERWKRNQNLSFWKGPDDRALRIFHAPNHKNIKGTEFFVKAVDDLKDEGLNIELILVEKVSNTKIREILETVDIIADQLIIGWYAMFALEGLSMEKTVLCYLDERYLTLYKRAGLIKNETIPIINSNPENVKDQIRDLYNDPTKLEKLGGLGRKFVEEYHSTKSIGEKFHFINRELGLPQCL